jgi:peptide deformylase
MSTLTILEFPDERLRHCAEPVSFPDDQLQNLIADMALAMYAAPGIGLAATQVNRPLRLFIMDLSKEQNQLQVFVNPEILENQGVTSSEEGCLSVPGMYETIERSEEILLSWCNEQGEHQQQRFEGLEAICIQHELDHLDGKLFVDHISRLKRDRIRKKLLKLKTQPEVA